MSARCPRCTRLLEENEKRRKAFAAMLDEAQAEADRDGVYTIDEVAREWMPSSQNRLMAKSAVLAPLRGGDFSEPLVDSKDNPTPQSLCAMQCSQQHAVSENIHISA